MEALVIGCGVSGLSSAIRLLENGIAVTIITRDLPQDTTSAVAGAIWAGYGLTGQQQSWATASLKAFQALAQERDNGVRITSYREVFRHPEALPWYQELADNCETIPADQLPEGFVSGFISDVPLIQSPKYLTYLLNTFYALGGVLEQRTIQSLEDVSDYPLVINCTGVDARHVANDEAVHPIWGQVLLVDAPQIKNAIIDDEQFTYLYPREDGVILGGIHIHDRWQREPDDAITADIATRCQELIPQLGTLDKVKTLVGLRPGRHAVRLEAESINANCTVIHNYGHGGVGYTLSWGCADEVVALVNAL